MVSLLYRYNRIVPNFQDLWEIKHMHKQWIPGSCTHFSCSWTINEPHLPKKIGLDIMQSHPLRKICFNQYLTSSAALGWPGDGDCYLTHRMQSGGWHYSKVDRDSSKALFLCGAVFRLKIVYVAVFHSNISCNWLYRNTQPQVHTSCNRVKILLIVDTWYANAEQVENLSKQQVVYSHSLSSY